MTIAPIPGTDTVSYINDPVGNKANALVVIPVNADGTAMGGGTSANPDFTIIGATGTPADGLSNANSVVSPFDNNNTARPGFRAFGMVFNGTTWDRARGDTTGAYVVQKGAATVAANQVSVGTTVGGTQIVATRSGRGRVTITNLGTTDVFIGATGVTTTTGQLLTGTKGASITLHTSAAIFGIVGTGTQSVSYIEEY